MGQDPCTPGWTALWEFLYFFYFWLEEENSIHFYGKLCFSGCSKHRAIFKYEWMIFMFQNKWRTYCMWVLRPPSFLTCSFWIRAGMVIAVAAGKDPRVLAGSVRNVLGLINDVCFDTSTEKQEDEQPLDIAAFYFVYCITTWEEMARIQYLFKRFWNQSPLSLFHLNSSPQPFNPSIYGELYCMLTCYLKLLIFHILLMGLISIMCTIISLGQIPLFLYLILCL